MTVLFWVALSFLVVVILLFLVVVIIYNKLIKSRNRVKNSWSQIDVQMKRRFDLIPNLVETTKGYAKHEANIFEEFAKARGAYNTANLTNSVEGVIEANNMLSSTLSRLIAVSEAYPELKADKNFAKMMEELRDTEDKIAYSRQFYNDVVLIYNNLREVFPTNIISNIFGFAAQQFFVIDDLKEKENIKVKL